MLKLRTNQLQPVYLHDYKELPDMVSYNVLPGLALTPENKTGISIDGLKTAVITATIVLICFLSGCALQKKEAMVKGYDGKLNENDIIRSETMTLVSFDEMIGELSEADVVLLGEQHRNRRHHELQLEIIKAIYRKSKSFSVGLEMFDITYQPILDFFKGKKLDEKEFIEKTHWYANWRFDFELYRPILSFVMENGIPAYALNIPSQIPPKILAGGTASLFGDDKKFLPKCFPTDNKKYLEDLKRIFAMHNLKNRDNFDYFYEAQCVWDARMAESIIENIDNGKMAVLVGAGHAQKNCGITEQIEKKSTLSVKSVILMSQNNEKEITDADFYYVTK